MKALLASPIRFAVIAGCSLAGALSEAQAGIGGATQGMTVTAPPLAKHPLSRDDRDVTTSYNVTALSSSSLITQATEVFDVLGYNFVFAGAPSGPGSHFTPIDESAFEISVYEPWVVTSPDIKSNGTRTYNRGVTNQDAGGLNILIDYIPTGNDPTSVNFVQAYEIRENGGPPDVSIDNCGAASPYYNKNCVAGTDSNDNATVPLDASNVEAWMLDDPYICESGRTRNGQGCPATTPQNDETFTSYNDLFDTFIEADGTYDNKTYQVLYAGFRWGFDFTATDVPEPSSWALMLAGFVGLGLAGYRASRSSVAIAR